jgi:hypothetical protein
MKIAARDRKPLLALVLLFVITRGIALLYGMRYLSDETLFFYQFLDLGLLRNHLLRSLLHLHGQPPLLNALLGLSLKIAGTNYGGLMLAIQFVFALAGILCVYLCLVELRVRAWLAFGIALLLLFNPSEIFFEFDALYTCLVVALNCFIALALTRYIHAASVRRISWLAGLCVCMTLLRSSFQWIWIAGLFGVLWWSVTAYRRQVLYAACIATFFALLLPAKNSILYGHFVSSTWAPFSMTRHWNVTDPASKSYRLLQEGDIPSFTFQAENTEGKIADLQQHWNVKPTGWPELDNITKTSGDPNWNSLAMLNMEQAREHDLKFLLRHDRSEYITSVELALVDYFDPTSKYMTLGFQHQGAINQYKLLAPVDRVLDTVCCRPFGRPLPPSKVSGTGKKLLNAMRSPCLGVLLLVFLSATCLVSLPRREFWRNSELQKAVAATLLFTIAYMSVVVNLVEVGENMRFRFEIQSLLFIVAALFIEQVMGHRASNKPSRHH